MLHQGQGLSLSRKPLNNFPGIHARFDHLEGHHPVNWLGLFRPINQADSTFTQTLQQEIPANPTSGKIFTGDIRSGNFYLPGTASCGQSLGFGQGVTGAFVQRKQLGDALE